MSLHSTWRVYEIRRLCFHLTLIRLDKVALLTSQINFSCLVWKNYSIQPLYLSWLQVLISYMTYMGQGQTPPDHMVACEVLISDMTYMEQGQTPLDHT